MKWLMILVLLCDVAAAEVGGGFDVWYRPSDTAMGISAEGRLDSLRLTLGATADQMNHPFDVMNGWASFGVEVAEDADIGRLSFLIDTDTTPGGSARVQWAFKYITLDVGAMLVGDDVLPLISLAGEAPWSVFPFARFALAHGWSIEGGIGIRFGECVMRLTGVALGREQPLWMSHGRTWSRNGTVELVLSLGWNW